MKKLMSKFKVLTVFVAAFFMVLALPARSEAAAAYKIVNLNMSFSDADNAKVKVGKYYFWEETQSDRSSKVYVSKKADGSQKSLIYTTERYKSSGPLLTNGTYIWYVHEDNAAGTYKICRVKMNGKSKKVYNLLYTGFGHYVTLHACRNNYIYYSVYGNKGGNTEIFRMSVKKRYQNPKKVKTAEVYGGDGARYIYLNSSKSTTAMRVYDVKTKKTKTIKKPADAYLKSVRVFGGKLYYTIWNDGGYDLYRASVSGSSRKKLASGMEQEIDEIGKITSSAIWFKEYSNRWWKYTFKTGEAFRYDSLADYLADVQ
jgi:hypothetical protein